MNEKLAYQDAGFYRNILDASTVTSTTLPLESQIGKSRLPEWSLRWDTCLTFLARTFDTEYIVELSGFTEIDDQHLQLLDTLASARSWIAEGKEFIALLTLLGKLEDYALHHFHEEEALMVKYNYFDYDRHRQEHEWFRDYIHEQLARLTTNGDPDPALLTFVENWFVKHIEVEAELFRQHFK